MTQTPVAGASVSEETVQMAARLSNVGQTLLTASPFAGITPNFFVTSTAEVPSPTRTRSASSSPKG